MMYISIKKSLDNPVKNEKEIQDLDKVNKLLYS